MLGKRGRQQLKQRINKQLEHLAENMIEITDAWNARHRPENVLPHLFGMNVTGCLDTFPIYIFKPKDSAWARALFQGKYGGPVLKVCSSSRFLLCDFISV